MNAYYLHKPNGTPTKWSACGNCGRVANPGNYDISVKCCTCWECGSPLGSDRSNLDHYHADCKRTYDARMDVARLDRATEVTDYDGPLYCDGVHGGWGDGYFADMDDLWETLEDCDSRPEFAYCCTSHPVAHLDLSSILENACDDAYEDAQDDLSGIDALESAIAAFNEVNKDILTWYMDTKRKVRIPPAEVTA